MTFSLPDEERSWHLSCPFLWWVVAPDKSCYASPVQPGAAVAGTPEGQVD